VVVSDDASTPNNLERIKEVPGIDRLLLNETNTGLGANLNKVIRAAKGNYILYCQEDFLLDPDIEPVLIEAMQLLDAGTLDMVRLKANYRFPELKPLTENIHAIPSWSTSNFLVNTFQYSDNPFITLPGFFEELGYFLEGVRGDYGETEFAIRVLRFKKRIGITRPYLAHTNVEAESTIRSGKPGNKKGATKKLRQYLRAIRQHLEWAFYRKAKRGLWTYQKH
jgi:glycosyltransferase involved in cell wall biosynthesis